MVISCVFDESFSAVLSFGFNVCVLVLNNFKFRNFSRFDVLVWVAFGSDKMFYQNTVPCMLFFSEEGIEPLLELEDVMAVDIPEPKSLITYVHFIYQHFAGKQQ